MVCDRMLQLVGAAGNTVLHMAAATGAVDTVRLLLRRGNNVHTVNKAGEVRLQLPGPTLPDRKLTPACTTRTTA